MWGAKCGHEVKQLQGLSTLVGFNKIFIQGLYVHICRETDIVFYILVLLHTIERIRYIKSSLILNCITRTNFVNNLEFFILHVDLFLNTYYNFPPTNIILTNYQTVFRIRKHTQKTSVHIILSRSPIFRNFGKNFSHRLGSVVGATNQ